ncbi:hypothetical protein KCU67_g16926, partial [Aureobasidium melanogenum]
LKSQGQELPRPNYGEDTVAKASSPAKVSKSEQDEDEPEPETNTAPTSKLDRFKYEKKNHEATSDEED